MAASDRRSGACGVDPAPRRDFVVVAAGVALVAFGVRAAYARNAPPVMFGGGDNAWYDAVGRSFAEGRWGRLPGVFGHAVLSIRFLPAYPAVLAIGQRLLFWMRPYGAHIWTSVLLGTLTAALVALLAWRLTDRGGRRAQVVTSAVAGLTFAANPLVAGQSISLMSEALSVLGVVLFLLAFDRMRRAGRRRRGWPWLAAALSLAVLTRSEGLVLLGSTLVLAGCVASRDQAVRRKTIAVLLVGLAVAGLWSTVASVAARRPVALAANSGSLLLGSSCRASEEGSAIGFWGAPGCFSASSVPLSRRALAALAYKPTNQFRIYPQLGAPVEAEVSNAQLHIALRDIADRPDLFLRAVPFRLLRGAGLYWSAEEGRLIGYEGRSTDWEAAGRDFHHFVVVPLVLIAIVALVMPRRRLGRALRAIVARGRLVAPCTLVLVWLIMIAATYGSTRFRAPIEPVLSLLAGLAAATVVEAWSASRRDPMLAS